MDRSKLVLHGVAGHSCHRSELHQLRNRATVNDNNYTWRHLAATMITATGASQLPGGGMAGTGNGCDTGQRLRGLGQRGASGLTYAAAGQAKRGSPSAAASRSLKGR